MMNSRALDAHAERLRGLRIEEMQASRPEDVAEILANIPDKDGFNQRLQALMFGKLIPHWSNLDAREQVAVLGRLARWQLFVQSGEGGGRFSVDIYGYRQDVDLALMV